MFENLYQIYRECLPEYPVTETKFREILKPESACILWEEWEGEPAGFALLHENSLSLLCVRARFRHKGIGGRLLEAAEDKIRESGAKEIFLGRGKEYLLQGVPEGSAVEFFQRRGYTASWSSVDMSLPLKHFNVEALDIPKAPEDLSFRFAEDSDQAALLEAVADAKEDWLSLFQPCREPVLLALRKNEIAGFEFLAENGGRFVFGDKKVGSIGCVGVVNSQRDQGIGRRMVAEGARRLKEQGCDSVELRSVYLVDWYRKIGFEITKTQWMGEKTL